MTNDMTRKERERGPVVVPSMTSRITQPSPQLLIAAAMAFVALDARLIDANGFISEVLAGALEPGPEGRWDVSIIHHWGYWSHFDHVREESAWPIGRSTTPGELADFALDHHLLRRKPRDGDIFIQYGPVKREFVHAGVVVRVLSHGRYADRGDYFDVLAIEGNTGVDGSLDGRHTLRMVRRLSPGHGDRFIRWADVRRP